MPLTLSPVTPTDFPTFHHYAHTSKGDLSAPILPFSWPLSPSTSSPDSFTTRTTWSLNQQLHILLHDPTCHFLKVTDTSLSPPETISLGRWHYYENGYVWNEETRKREFEGPHGFVSETHKALTETALEPVFGSREQRFGKRPCWVLCTLKTREGFQRKGAGGLIVRWGVERAEREGVMAFVEGSEQGTPLYKNCGFEQTEVLNVDFSPAGIDMTVPLELLSYTPTALRK